MALDEFGWKDVTIAIEGVVVLAALGIKFTEDIERELIYGKGNLPQGVQDGNVKYEGSVKLHQSALQKLILLSGGEGVRALKNLTITFAMASGLRLNVRILQNVAITQLGEEYNQNDKFAEITVPFIFTKIIYA